MRQLAPMRFLSWVHVLLISHRTDKINEILWSILPVDAKRLPPDAKHQMNGEI